MGYNIKFSVHRNPLKDGEGNDTYQVRHETNETVGKASFLRHLKNCAFDSSQPNVRL